MSDSKIPPRPWRIDVRQYEIDIRDANGDLVFQFVERVAERLPIAALIVRLINSEAQVVEVLLRSRNLLKEYGGGYAVREARANLEVALALLMGYRPGEGKS